MDGKQLSTKWGLLGSSSGIDNWKTLWQECTDWCLPRKDSITNVKVEGIEKPVRRMIDVCISANYSFATGFFSRMFPPGSVWGKFKHPRPEVNEDDEVAYYFEECSRILHGVITESNFTQEMQESLMDIGCFGTNCIFAEPDLDSVVNFRSFSVNHLRIGLNHRGKVDTVGREFTLTSRQLIQEFGEKILRENDLSSILDEVTAGREAKHELVHLVCPRSDYDLGKTDKKSKRFASYYLLKKGNVLLKESGYDFMPYFVGRFAVGNEETYGRSPMMNVLSTARRANTIYRSLISIAEQNATPQWLIPDDDSVKGLLSRSPIVKWRATNPNGKPERLPANGSSALAQEIYDNHNEEIKAAFFNHLFRPLDDYRNMTAYEVNVRQSTDLMSLTTFSGRYYDEVVTPTLTYVFQIIDKAGLFPDPPKALLADPNFKIEYIGQLSLATMSFETSGAFSTMNMFAEVAQYVPSAQAAFENVDFDEIFRKTWYSNNAPMNALMNKETVEEGRAARAQAEARSKEQESMLMASQAAGMGNKAPEAGSPTEKFMKATGM